MEGERRNTARRQEDRDNIEMTRQALALAQSADNKISTHEAVCATRFLFIQKDLSDMKKIIVWGGCSLIVALIGAVGTLLMSGAHLSR